MQEEEDDEVLNSTDVPSNVGEAARQAVENRDTSDIVSAFPALSVTNPSGDVKDAETSSSQQQPGATTKKRSLSRVARGDIFREIVLAKVRDAKQEQEAKTIEAEALARAEAKR